MEKPRLSRGELEIMDALWRLGEATVQEVCDSLGRELAYTTVMTTLRILHAKKKVLQRIKRGRAHVYRPLVSRDDVGRSILADLKGVLFRGRVPSLVLNLLEEEALTSADVKALQAALREAQKKKEEA
jgi:predicted transcriptional regulator